MHLPDSSWYSDMSIMDGIRVKTIPQLLALTLLALLTGCASMKSTLADPQDIAVVPAAHEAGDSIMFNVLVAEISARRGDHDSTYEYYQRATRQTDNPAIAERGARLSIHSQNVERTISSTETWVERAPESVEARRILGALLLRNHQPDLAVKHFEKIIALKEADADGGVLGAFMLIAEQLRKEPNKVVASQVLRKVVRRSIEVPEAWYVQAWYYTKTKKPEKAMESVDRALSLRPGWGKAVVLRVSIMESLGETKEVLSFLEEQVEEFTGDADIFIRYGQALLSQGRDYEALIQFKSALDIHPRSAEILSSIVLVHLSNKNYKHARPFLTRLLEIDGQEDKANYYFGELEEGLGNRKEAITHYASVTHGLIYFNARIRMATLIAEADIDAGISVLRGLSLHDNRRRIQVLLLEGGLLEESGRYIDAIETYSQALELSPGNEDILYTRAMAGDLAGRLDILERDLRAILDKNSGNYHAWNALGYTLTLRTTRYEEARGYLEKAIALRPNDFYVLDSMGWVLYKMGQIGEALDYLTRALDAKQDAEVAAHLGEVRWVSGDQDGASKVWALAKELDENNPILVEILERFSQ